MSPSCRRIRAGTSADTILTLDLLRHLDMCIALVFVQA